MCDIKKRHANIQAYLQIKKEAASERNSVIHISMSINTLIN